MHRADGDERGDGQAEQRTVDAEFVIEKAENDDRGTGEHDQ